MLIYLIRHAKAGERLSLTAGDLERELTRSGKIQAQDIAAFLPPSNPKRIVSSPYLRCVQTMEPTSQARGTKIEIDKRLGEVTTVRSLEKLLEAISVAATDTALCSHGNVVPTLLKLLGVYTMQTMLCQKGSIYVVDTVAHTATYHPAQT